MSQIQYLIKISKEKGTSHKMSDSERYLA